jgi:alpha-mannosidase
VAAKDRPHIDPLYSWILNNHWHTNYKADQEGWLTFPYSLLPQRGAFEPMPAARFGMECSQPLLVGPAAKTASPRTSLLQLDTPDVLVSALKPAEDGKGLIFAFSAPPARTVKST